MDGFTRRRVLGCVGAAAATGLAGCSSGSAEEAGDGGPTLEAITVENLDEDGHSVDVIVEIDQEIEHWSTHEVGADEDGVELDPDWPRASSDFRLRVRLDGERIAELASDDPGVVGCLNLLLLIDRDGTLSIYRNAAEECGPRAED